MSHAVQAPAKRTALRHRYRGAMREKPGPPQWDAPAHFRLRRYQYAVGAIRPRAVLQYPRLDFEPRLRDLIREWVTNRTVYVSETIQDQAIDFIDLAGELVSAYVSNNSVRPADLPALIATVHTALRNLADGTGGTGAGAQADEVEKPTAAQVRKSIRPDGLVSFIDGKTYQTLKRHLNGHGLHPHSYRERFGLPSDYPMTAPEYSARRSALAKTIGLGRPGRTSA